MEMVDKFDTFVLFSGDSDFDYLLQFLKRRSKITVVVSAKHHVAKELIETSDKYIDLKKLRLLIERKKQN